MADRAFEGQTGRGAVDCPFDQSQLILDIFVKSTYSICNTLYYVCLTDVREILRVTKEPNSPTSCGQQSLRKWGMWYIEYISSWPWHHCFWHHVHPKSQRLLFIHFDWWWWMYNEVCLCVI